MVILLRKADVAVQNFCNRIFHSVRCKKWFKVQTDDEIREDIQLYEDDSPELADFLRRIEPHVYKELQKNRQSHAFDGICVYNVTVALFSPTQKHSIGIWFRKN